MPGGGGAAGSGQVPVGGTQQSNAILQNFPTDPGQTPAAQFWPTAQQAVSTIANNPYWQTATQQLGYAQQGAYPAYQQNMAAANQIYGQAFDPQQALYNQTLNQTQQQSAAANANSGVMGTPYGQSVADNATNQFNLNWQNQQLNRQIAGAQAVPGLESAAQANLTTALNAPLQSGIMPQVTDYLGAAGSALNIGNNQYMLPQQVVSDLNQQSQLGLQAEQLQLQSQQMQNQAMGGALGGLGSFAGQALGGITGS